MEGPPILVGAEWLEGWSREAARESLARLKDGRDLTGGGIDSLVADWLLQVYPSDVAYRSDIPRRVAPKGTPVTYTAAMFLEAYPARGPLIELLHNRSPDSDESEIAGTAVFLLSLGYDVLEELLISGMLLIPLNCWWRELKPGLTVVRRSLRLGDLVGERLLCLRKMLNLTIRSRDDADIAMENFNRCCVITRKHIYGHVCAQTARSAYTDYEEAFLEVGREMVKNTLTNASDGVQEKTIDEFWAERAIRGATGASKAIKRLETNISEMSGADRPGKKVLVEYLMGILYRTASLTAACCALTAWVSSSFAASTSMPTRIYGCPSTL